jgi:predicted ATPase
MENRTNRDMKHNKIGFNNFKSFGEKIQTFSDKPLTLVYGPNSVGKSSFLHSQLYREYLKSSANSNFEISDFAGDRLDFGGFENFIHKNDTSNKITFKHTIYSYKDIDDFLGSDFTKIKQFSKKGVIEKGLALSHEQFWEKFNNYKVKEGELLIADNMKKSFKKTKNLYKTRVVKEYLAKDKEASNNIDKAWSFNFHMIADINKKLFSREITQQEFKDALISETQFKDRVVARNGDLFDDLDELILKIFGDFGFIQAFHDRENIDESKLFEKFYNTFKYFKEISEINSVGFEISHTPFINQKIIKKSNNILLNFYINNSRVFKGEGNKNDFKAILTKEGDLFLKKLYKVEYLDIQSTSHSYAPYDIDFGSFSRNAIEDLKKDLGLGSIEAINQWTISKVQQQFFQQEKVDLLQSSKSFIYSLLLATSEFIKDKSSYSVQYFSPLRYYPDRDDLILSEKDTLNVTKGITAEVEKKLENNNIVSPAALKYMTKFVDSPKIVLNVMSFFLLITSLKFWNYLFNVVFSSTEVIDSINYFKKKRNKKSIGRSNNSERLWSYLISSKKLQKYVNHWLQDSSKLKSTYELKTKEIIETNWLRKIFHLKSKKFMKLQFIDERTGTPVTPRDMGLGISQFLPILISSLVLERSKIYIEQPELHLHPALQCEVADEFIRSKNIQNNKFIIESHSEHLLLRVMKRLRHSAEGKFKKGDELYLTPEDICLLYVDNNGDFTYLNELELDEDGTLLDPWPNGFFEEGQNERFD